MLKKVLIPIFALLAIGIIYFATKGDSNTHINYLSSTPKKAVFVQSIFASGELKAKKSLKIRAPDGMRSAGIYQTSIKDLITEGTFVNKGDYIGSLDRTELAGKLSEINSEIETERTRLEQTKIDTAIAMKEIRDQIADVEFDITNERLEMQKNIYEPEMTIEQSRINLKKSERTLRQHITKQELLKIQSESKVKEVEGIINQLQTKLKMLSDLSANFSLTAPESGMLIYASTWNGKKGPGSQISSWDPIVGELPDLSKMTSIAYVNEVDISKITKGQIVEITVDAFPEKLFTGNIIKVANIGQELRNQDAKVFEITIEINEKDDILKPAMTTSNLIKIYQYPEVWSVPLDAFYSDSINYVMVKEGKQIFRQEVISGPFNEDHIVVVAGIDESDEILLSRITDIELKVRWLTAEDKQAAQLQIEKWKVEKKVYDKTNLENVKEREEPNIEDLVVSNMIIG